MKKIRLGIIGTGIATHDLYLPHFGKLRARFEFAACCNRRKSKALAFAKKAGIPRVYDNYQEMLAQPDIDAVMISLPIALNAKVVLAALKAGKHVMCEKPIARDSKEGAFLMKAAAKYKKVFLVAENYYFAPHIIQARNWVKSGKIGRVRLIEGRQVSRLTHDNKYFQTKWRQKPNHVGGFIVDGGVHVANIAREMLGLPVAVKSFKALNDRALVPHDTLTATMKFKNGALGVWMSAFSTPDTDGHPMLRVLGEKGAIEVWWAQSVLTQGKRRSVAKGNAHEGFLHEFLHFYDVVMNKKKLGFSSRQALDDLIFMERLLG
jgi:predicted dehydrogenase